ncbi:hypothetical protein CPAR01_09292 [Colletotrichum paranaense]|uniref:Uncharacterized protein n=1 Tax=Colletotrichum paranaense TaxID=1914294 RepID=A0ABQ9SGB7_9PEZI|nr:uncharacterized protein CPAR01_09292 [Colletotrichum paranaense]KAK1535750.1 hypothetical protein CPAR01_09292 [Colletotrichum paranaense]
MNPGGCVSRRHNTRSNGDAADSSGLLSLPVILSYDDGLTLSPFVRITRFKLDQLSFCNYLSLHCVNDEHMHACIATCQAPHKALAGPPMAPFQPSAQHNQSTAQRRLQ